MDLKTQKCVPCEEGAPTLTGEEVKNYIQNIPDWELIDDDSKIKREYAFGNFSEAIQFINKVAEIAEAEGHHPDICLYDFKKVRFELWTHKIGGLHKNDFILAYKIEELFTSNFQ